MVENNNKKVLRVYRDPGWLRSQMTPPHMLKLVVEAERNKRPALLNVSTGTGKSHAMKEFILSGIWKGVYALIVILVYTYKQGEEVYSDLLAQGVNVKCYPRVEEMQCDLDKEAMDLIENSMGSLFYKRYCERCEHIETCPYPKRTKAEFAADCDVLILREQVLSPVPKLLSTYADDRSIAVFYDECRNMTKGFVQTFTAADVEAEMKAGKVAGFELCVDLCRSVLSDPQRLSSDYQYPGKDYYYFSQLADLQEAGLTVKGYENILLLILEYAQRPYWYDAELGIYAVLRYPWFPHSTILMGAFLPPGLLARQFGIPEPKPVFPGVVVAHPETKFYNIQSMGGCAKYLPGNKDTIINLVAELVARNVGQGLCTVLVGRKDSKKMAFASEAMAALKYALGRRGINDITILGLDDEIPVERNPKVLVYVTYGAATGINAVEEYESVLFVHGFYMSDVAVRDLIYADVPVSKRPEVQIMKGRRVKLEKGSSKNLIKYAQEALSALEEDPVLQAAGRSRHAVKPRFVVICTAHNVGRLIGPVITFKNFEEARAGLGLLSTKQERQRRVGVEILKCRDRGLTVGETATLLGQLFGGVSKSSIERWARKNSIKFGRVRNE